LATAELIDADHPASESERKKIVTACVKRVAQRLGNTPAIARGSYIDPRVIHAYSTNHGLADMRTAVENIDHQEFVTPAERAFCNYSNDKST